MADDVRDPAGGRVALTGVQRNGFAQILLDGQLRWVNADYLSAKKPQDDPAAGPSGDDATLPANRTE